MAADDSKQAYPKVPAKAWYTIRGRAASSPSTRFTPQLVATLLDLNNEKSARDNVLLGMNRLGILKSDDWSLTERGQKWRLDDSYAEACDGIISEVYPEELAALTDDDGKPDLNMINSWFARKGYGTSNAGAMARTFALVASKSPTAPEPTQRERPAEKAVTTAKKAAARAGGSSGSARPEHQNTPPPPAPPVPRREERPTIHVDLQIHISSDATAEQIDHVFASMAKHLYDKTK